MDNDQYKSAEKIINKSREVIRNDSRFSLKYDMQPEKNIALTRNKTIELAEGDYIFFIDDDEYADEFCLFYHLKTLKEFSGDITIGNVLPYFESDTPDYIKRLIHL